jgi:hypothetical protein
MRAEEERRTASTSRQPCRADRAASIAILAAAVAGSALLASGCGGSSSSGVPHVGSTTSAGSKAPSGDSFSKCMRSHGVPLFPDPNSKGQISPGAGVDVNSPLFRAAQNACRSLLPKGGSFTAGGTHLGAQQLTQMLRYARCMRSRGLPKFPDPTGHGLALEPNQVDLDSPQFKSADRACRSLLPKFPAGATHTAGGSMK